MTSIPSFKLNNGVALPAIGLGSWMGKPAEAESQELADTVPMIKTALKAHTAQLGYLHLDTAAGYGNEESVGVAIRESGVPREKIHVTTKIAMDYSDVSGSFQASLKRLGLDYIDLYLVHWPQAIDPKTEKTLPRDASPTFEETWMEMEKLYETGKVKAIGVSNFSIKNLEALLKSCKVVPAVNQVQCHPYMPQHELLKYCSSKGIHITAYTPLGQRNSPIQKDPAIQAIAKAHGVVESQVLLSWVVQRGISAVPKSANEGRMKKNIELIKLKDEEMKILSELHTEPGKYKNMCDFAEGIDKEKGILFGWRIVEDMGWDLVAYQ